MRQTRQFYSSSSSSYNTTITVAKKKLHCLKYAENYNMWCSTNPCDNCIDYALCYPQWCFAGSIRSRLDNGKQCDLTKVSTNPICRGCLIKYCHKNSIFDGDSSLVPDIFVANKNNFNCLFIISKRKEHNSVDICLWGSIKKDEQVKKYSASSLTIPKKICTARQGKIFDIEPSFVHCKEKKKPVSSPLHCSPISQASASPISQVSSAPPSLDFFSLDDSEEMFLAEGYNELLILLKKKIVDEYKKDNEIFLECATEEDLDTYFIDKREKELEKIQSRDFDYTAAEKNGLFLKALITGERYVVINDTDMVDISFSAPDEKIEALKEFKTQFENGVDTLLKHFPHETIKKAYLTGMIKKLLEVIV